MIPDITFEEFVNNLFDYTKTPLENRNGITALYDNNITYHYDWGEIEDYINRWLKLGSIDKLDAKVKKALTAMDKIVDDWYLLNFNHTGGRTGYNDEPYIDRLDREEFYFHTQVRELIWKQAKEVRTIEEARLAEEKRIKEEQTKKKKEELKFEEYLLCPQDKKEALMKKLRQLFRTAEPKDAFMIYKAMEELGFIQPKERGKKRLYEAINTEFNKNYSPQNFDGHNTIYKGNKNNYKDEVRRYKDFLNN